MLINFCVAICTFYVYWFITLMIDILITFYDLLYMCQIELQFSNQNGSCRVKLI